MTKKITPIYRKFDVVAVPFPFTNTNLVKKRPALVISSEKTFNSEAGHSVMLMITSAHHRPWPLDVSIADYTDAGLPKPSIIHLKFFTLDHRLIIKKLGTLSKQDQTAVVRVLEQLLPLRLPKK
jgi:mRNA interferase MazF